MPKDSEDPGHTSTRRIPRQAPVLLAAALLILHALWILSLWRPAYTGADAPGYFVQGRLIATEGTASLSRESPIQYVGVHWLPGADGRLHSRYPPGFPLLIAQVYRLAGPTAALLVNPILASVSLLCFALLAWRWTRPWFALAGMTVLALLAPFGEQALEGFAHMATTATLLAALYLLDRWREHPKASTGFIAGLLIGSLPGIRYPAVAPGVVLGVSALLFFPSARHRRVTWAVVLGAAIPLVALLRYNDVAFGSPFATGYGASQEQAAFGLSYLAGNVLRYGFTLARDAAPAVLLGSLGVLLLLQNRETRSRGLLLAALVVPVTLLYMAYYSPFADSRKLLPTLPLYILAAVTAAPLVRDSLAVRVVAALVVLHVALAAVSGIPRTTRVGAALARASTVRATAQGAIPDGSVVVAPLGYETILEYEGRWRLVDWRLLWTQAPPRLQRGSPERVAATRRMREDSILALENAAPLPDDSTVNGRLRGALLEVLDWAAGSPVIWIDTGGWLGDIEARTGLRFRRAQVAEVEDHPGRTSPLRSDAWWIPELPASVLRVTLDSGIAIPR